MEATIVERVLHRLRVWQLSEPPSDELFTLIGECIEDLLRAQGYRIKP